MKTILIVTGLIFVLAVSLHAEEKEIQIKFTDVGTFEGATSYIVTVEVEPIEVASINSVDRELRSLISPFDFGWYTFGFWSGFYPEFRPPKYRNAVCKPVIIVNRK